ncbi:MAG: hypothetical protein ACOYD1_07835 [Candidatus Nanopelagicales bacterium]
MIISDDHETERRIFEALAWAGGISREKLPLMPDDAMRRWAILTQAVMTELRILNTDPELDVCTCQVGGELGCSVHPKNPQTRHWSYLTGDSQTDYNTDIDREKELGHVDEV